MSISGRRLAQLAGISPATAWRALHGQYGVSEEIQRKVLALAKKHQFPLPAMRAPETPNLLNVCASCIDIQGDASAQGFNHRLLTGLQQGAAACGAESSNYQPNGLHEANWPLAVTRQEVDGVILPLGNEFARHPLFPAPVPAVFLFNGPAGADVVTVANFDASLAIGRHLAALGHKRAAYIGFQSNLSVERLYGLRAGLESAGASLPPENTFLRKQVGPDEFRMLTDKLLETARPGDTGPHGVTALMVYNDYFAAVVIQRLRERGVKVPEELSVVGFDNVRPPDYDCPPLTTVAMPLEELGAEAVRMLYWRLAHPHAPPRKLVLAAPLVLGETARAVS
jgi:DNA-binding LacI/PurR family transcriptional regulator